jgi:hypothetical protein
MGAITIKNNVIPEMKYPPAEPKPLSNAELRSAALLLRFDIRHSAFDIVSFGSIGILSMKKATILSMKKARVWVRWHRP